MFYDHNPQGQAEALSRIVDVLTVNAAHETSGPRVDRIAGALTTYRAAVVELTLAGDCSVDQAAELMEIVDRIEAEASA